MRRNQNPVRRQPTRSASHSISSSRLGKGQELRSTGKQPAPPDPFEQKLRTKSSEPGSRAPIPDTPLQKPLDNRVKLDEFGFPKTADDQNSLTAQDIEAFRLRWSGQYGKLHESAQSNLPPENPSWYRQPSSSAIPPELRPVTAPNSSRKLATSASIEEDEESPIGDMDSAAEIKAMKNSQSHGRYTCIVVSLLVIFVCAGVGVGVGIWQRNSKSGGTSGSTTPSPSRPLARCDYYGLQSNGTIPSVFKQCFCEGHISTWTDEISDQYSDLRDNFILSVLPEFDEEEQSCDPTNTALWQLANDTLFNVNATDTRYLVTLLYANWEGGLWRRNENWLSVEVPECEWQGIQCDNDNQVRRLSLSANNLGGTLPTELALLSELQTVEFDSNRLQGTLPLELTQLGRLEGLFVSVNYLEGTIPFQIAGLPYIERLMLDFNTLSGTIPTEIGLMKSLRLLGLGWNKLSGPIPSEIGQLTRLNVLRFEDNTLSGLLPFELGQLEDLTTLTGGRNLFRGQLPTQIGDMTRLRTLDLQQAGLAGFIPSELGRNFDLSVLSLSHNNFVGPLPTEMLSLTNMTYLRLADNALSGAIPTELGMWPTLSELELHANFFEGTVPSEIGVLSLLSTLNLGHLPLSGTAPKEVCTLRQGPLDNFVAPCESGNFLCGVPDCCTACEPSQQSEFTTETTYTIQPKAP